MAKTYSFLIPIGDWSDDGHGKCDYFQFSSNKPLKAVREAFFKATRDDVALNPEGFCCDYEDGTVPDEIVEAAAARGFEIDPENFFAEDMADYVAWYTTLGDPSLELKRRKSLNMLPFYGCDMEKRHIGFFGYGLFQ